MNSSFFIRGDGQVVTIGDPPIELGEGVRKRASSIVPLHHGKRLCFLVLRALFGEHGRVAAYTRNWQGPWLTTIFATNERFITQSRWVALKVEHERLEQILSEN